MSSSIVFANDVQKHVSMCFGGHGPAGSRLGAQEPGYVNIVVVVRKLQGGRIRVYYITMLQAVEAEAKVVEHV